MRITCRSLGLSWVHRPVHWMPLMRTLCLNLDLSDAEILREAVERQLEEQPVEPAIRLVDDRTRSLRATLDVLTQMIERPMPRRRLSSHRTGREQSVTPRRIH